MAPILANPEVQQRLMPYLPSGESLPQSSEELHNTLSSPQFQQVKLLPSVFNSISNQMNLILKARSLVSGWCDKHNLLLLVYFHMRFYSIWSVRCCIFLSAGLWWLMRLSALGYLPSLLVFVVPLQAMSMFSSALASGQLGPLMNQFGLPAEAVDAANKGGPCFTNIPFIHLFYI